MPALGCGERGRESESPPSRQHHTMTTGAPQVTTAAPDEEARGEQGGASGATPPSGMRKGPRAKKGAASRAIQAYIRAKASRLLLLERLTAFERRSGSPSVTHRMHSQFRGCHLQAGRG